LRTCRDIRRAPRTAAQAALEAQFAKRPRQAGVKPATNAREVWLLSERAISLIPADGDRKHAATAAAAKKLLKGAAVRSVLSIFSFCTDVIAFLNLF
jgi:hypothetical protein